MMFAKLALLALSATDASWDSRASATLARLAPTKTPHWNGTRHAKSAQVASPATRVWVVMPLMLVRASRALFTASKWKVWSTQRRHATSVNFVLLDQGHFGQGAVGPKVPAVVVGVKSVLVSLKTHACATCTDFFRSIKFLRLILFSVATHRIQVPRVVSSILIAWKLNWVKIISMCCSADPRECEHRY